MRSTTANRARSNKFEPTLPSAHSSSIANSILALASMALIVACNHFEDTGITIVAIGALGIGQAWAYRLYPDLGLKDRVFSALSLLVAFTACFTPGALSAEPLGWGLISALAIAGSIPRWVQAVWTFLRERRSISST